MLNDKWMDGWMMNGDQMHGYICELVLRQGQTKVGDPSAFENIFDSKMILMTFFLKVLIFLNKASCKDVSYKVSTPHVSGWAA